MRSNKPSVANHSIGKILLRTVSIHVFPNELENLSNDNCNLRENFRQNLPGNLQVSVATCSEQLPNIHCNIDDNVAILRGTEHPV